MRVPIERGYSLIEMVIVVAVLALIAAIAAPGRSSTADKQLDLAAEEFAAAMRFARTEAIRLNQPHGFDASTTQKRIRVFRLNTTTPVYDVYHPINKSLYDIELDTQSLATAGSLTSNTVYRGTCAQQNQIYFDSNGTPWCANPVTVLLEQFELHLYLGSNHKTVTVDSLTGRVTIQ